LFAAQFFENLSDVCSFLAIVERAPISASEAADMTFFITVFAFHVYRSIRMLDVGRFSVLAQAEIAAHSGPGLRLAQVGGISVDIESHVTFMKSDRCIWMGSGVVEKLDGRLHPDAAVRFIKVTCDSISTEMPPT
jgi:hypothetical protein